jgi:uncharacterized ferritin-like protein (DUF455 family)
MALRALRVRDPARKCECVERLLEAWRVDGLGIDPADPPPVRIEIPGRPERPELVRPQDLPRRGLHTLPGRQALLHAVTHIEFNAINLALDAVYRFRDLPPEYISDWLQVAAEEARHFQMLARRLEAVGSAYGACRRTTACGRWRSGPTPTRWSAWRWCRGCWRRAAWT